MEIYTNKTYLNSQAFAQQRKPITKQNKKTTHRVGENICNWCDGFCCVSVAKSFPTLRPHGCSTPGFPVHHHLLEFAQTHVHWVGHTIQPSHPLLSPSPPALNLSQHQSLFQRVGTLHQVVKDWSFSFSISPSNEYSGLISFRLDQFDLLAVQGILKSLI